MPLDSSQTSITTTTGPPFIIIILNWALFGALSIQVYLYSLSFPKDKPILKILVYGVYLVETAQTFLLTETTWARFVSGFGNTGGLDDVGTTWLSVCCIGGIVALLVQWFYAYRIVVFSQKKIIPGFIILMSLISFAGALATAVNTKTAIKFSNLRLQVDNSWVFTAIGLWGVSSCICDIAITACMCYYLQRRSENITFSRTQTLVSRLIRMTVETGLVTEISHSYFQVPLSAHAKFYSTTMLAVLNSRIKPGIRTEPTTWQENDLAFDLAHSRDTNAIEINISSASPLQSTNVISTDHLSARKHVDKSSC